MANITAKLVKELRERTGSGMMECKKALVSAEGDIEKAAADMRKSGQAKADKKASRVAAEGVVEIAVAGDKAIMLEINSETDFVARDESFKDFAKITTETALAAGVSDIESALEVKLPSGETVDEARKTLIATIGEYIKVRRMAVLSAPVVGSYVHGGKIGVVVGLSGGDKALAKDIAMHVAATSPMVVSPEDVPADVIAKEKEIFVAQAEASGKSADIIERMVEGKVHKFLGEVALLGQPFVKNSNVKIKDLVKKAGVSIESFIQIKVGEGVEKKEEDFAAEVMKQING